MPEYKMQAEKRAEIQSSAVSLNTIHKKVMQTKGGQQLETEMISFRLTVQTEIELGATREIFDSLFEGGKIPTDSQAYAIISAVLTKFNAANGLTGASGGGGGATDETEANTEATTAASTTASNDSDKPFHERLLNMNLTFIRTKVKNVLTKEAEKHGGNIENIPHATVAQKIVSTCRSVETKKQTFLDELGESPAGESPAGESSANETAQKDASSFKEKETERNAKPKKANA